MLTGTGKENAIQSILNHTLKTRLDVLPQSRALADSPAGTPGQARNGAGRNAGGLVVRGERGFGRSRLGNPGDSASGVSRVFVLERRADGRGCNLETPGKSEKASVHGTRDIAFLPALKDEVSRELDG